MRKLLVVLVPLGCGNVSDDQPGPDEPGPGTFGVIARLWM